MSNADVLTQFDEWLKDGSPVAALVMRQWLVPVEGKDAVIFPPTYAKPERMREEDWLGYNIDRFEDGSSVCQIDSVGSQANRMEPLFKKGKYAELIPQVIIKLKTNNGDKEVNMLDAGHRAADAIVRFADKPEGEENAEALGEKLWNAFKAWQDFGDAEPLARIAPTSIVFGSWDSRATQAKIPRVVRSVIRAYDVRVFTRSAQFTTPLHYVDEGVIDESLDKGEGEKNPLAQEGFRHSPAAASHGGIQVMGEIRRDAILNLVALRTLGVRPKDGETPEQRQKRVMQLRRYILGLSLVALSHRDDQQFNLREGCLLRIVKSSLWKTIPFEGEEKEVIDLDQNAPEFADEAARDFTVEKFNKPFVFNSAMATNWLKLKKEDRDKRRRKGPAIKQDI